MVNWTKWLRGRGKRGKRRVNAAREVCCSSRTTFTVCLSSVCRLTLCPRERGHLPHYCHTPAAFGPSRPGSAVRRLEDGEVCAVLYKRLTSAISFVLQDPRVGKNTSGSLCIACAVASFRSLSATSLVFVSKILIRIYNI